MNRSSKTSVYWSWCRGAQWSSKGWILIDNAEYEFDGMKWKYVDLPELESITSSRGGSFRYVNVVTLESSLE